MAPTESDNWLDLEQTSRYNNVSNLTGESPVFSFAKRAREIGAGRAQLWSTRPIPLPAQPAPAVQFVASAPQLRVAQPPALPSAPQPAAPRPGLTPPAGFLAEAVSAPAWYDMQMQMKD